ncbi:MAG: hypothetical protein WCO53_10665, partial [Deltaproteobacteria bacterium]
YLLRIEIKHFLLVDVLLITGSYYKDDHLSYCKRKVKVSGPIWPASVAHRIKGPYLKSIF